MCSVIIRVFLEQWEGVLFQVSLAPHVPLKCLWMPFIPLQACKRSLWCGRVETWSLHFSTLKCSDRAAGVAWSIDVTLPGYGFNNTFYLHILGAFSEFFSYCCKQPHKAGGRQRSPLRFSPQRSDEMAGSQKGLFVAAQAVVGAGKATWSLVKQ